VPGLGDGVQALKAGVLEVADLYVVNKSDLPGANATARELRAMLTLTPQRSAWAPAVLLVSAKDATGIERVAKELDKHRDWLTASGSLRQKRALRAMREISQELRREFLRRFESQTRADDLNRIVKRVAEREMSPKRAARIVLETWSVDA
jgi:LAO/AO transport system kinase